MNQRPDYIGHSEQLTRIAELIQKFEHLDEQWALIRAKKLVEELAQGTTLDLPPIEGGLAQTAAFRMLWPAQKPYNVRRYAVVFFTPERTVLKFWETRDGEAAFPELAFTYTDPTDPNCLEAVRFLTRFVGFRSGVVTSSTRLPDVREALTERFASRKSPGMVTNSNTPAIPAPTVASDMPIGAGHLSPKPVKVTHHTFNNGIFTPWSPPTGFKFEPKGATDVLTSFTKHLAGSPALIVGVYKLVDGSIPGFVARVRLGDEDESLINLRDIPSVLQFAQLVAGPAFMFSELVQTVDQEIIPNLQTAAKTLGARIQDHA